MKMKNRNIVKWFGSILALVVLLNLFSPTFMTVEGEGDEVDYIFDIISIEGSSLNDKAIFNLTGYFYVTEGKVIFMKIISLLELRFW